MPEGIPTYQQVDPITGEVTNEFDGRIKADGIILPADETAGLSESSQIRWERESNGALVAYDYTYVNPANVANRTRSIVVPNVDNTDLDAYLSVGNDGAGITYVDAFARGPGDFDFRRILDGTGRSDFAQNRTGRRILEHRLFWDTGLSPNLAPDADWITTTAHGFGIINATEWYAVGGLYDGNFAAGAGWRFEIGFDFFRIAIGNPSGRNPIRAGWRGTFLRTVN